MNKTNEQVQAGVVRYWERQARQHNMTVDEYHEYRKAQNEQKRREWGLSMADAITIDDARSLQIYACQLTAAATYVYETAFETPGSDALGEMICQLHDKLRLVTAVLDRIEENRR
jgi:hypothetical protein